MGNPQVTEFDLGWLNCRVEQATVLRDFVEIRLKAGKEPYGIDEQILYHSLRQLND